MKTNKEITDEIHEIAKNYAKKSQNPYISILQPRRDLNETPAQQLMNWQNRHINVTSISVSYHAIDGNPVDSARCYLMEKALEDDSKYALFIDEDTALPYQGVMNMLKASEEYPDAIITGVYYVKFGNVMTSVLDDKDRWLIPDVTPNTGLIRNVISTGLGCALIPMHLIRRIKEKFEDLPLFCIIGEKTWDDEDVLFMGEDTWFYNLVHKCGIEVISDTSVQCIHMELKTGKYSAHPDVDLNDYLTNIPITTRLTLEDLPRVSKDYMDRLCKPEHLKIEEEKENEELKNNVNVYDNI